MRGKSFVFLLSQLLFEVHHHRAVAFLLKTVNLEIPLHRLKEFPTSRKETFLNERKKVTSQTPDDEGGTPSAPKIKSETTKKAGSAKPKAASKSKVAKKSESTGSAPTILFAPTKSPQAPGMDYVQLGRSDLTVSRVCLGTMTWGQQTKEVDAIKQLNMAFDEYGVNFLDTAETHPEPIMLETWGSSDRYIGKWLKGRKREDVVIASKVSGYSDILMHMRPLRPKIDATRLTEDQIVFSVDSTLRLLGTDYIDLLQLHWPDRYVPLWGDEPYDLKENYEAVPFETQLQAVQTLIRAGKVRYVGLSNETPYGVCKFLEATTKLGLPRVHTIQNCYNLLSRNDFDSGLMEVCRPQNADVSLLAYSPLAGGALAGKYVVPNAAPDDARLTLFPGYMARYKNPSSRIAVAKFMEVAENHGLTPVQLALAWTYSRPYISSVVVGASNVNQLRENLDAYKIKMSQKLEEDIYGVYNQYREAARGVSQAY